MLGARIGEPLGERGRDAVLLRHDGRHRGPRNRERRVVPADAALAPRAVLGRALVEYDRVLLEGEGAVREAGRHPDDLVVAPAELDGDVMAERGRPDPHVNDDVEDRAGDAAHELPHRRVPLEVEAAHDAAARAGLDGLLELARQSARGEVRRHPRLEQETALVREDGGLEYPDRRDAARVDQHSVLRLQKRMGPWYRGTPERGSIAR